MGGPQARPRPGHGGRAEAAARHGAWVRGRGFKGLVVSWEGGGGYPGVIRKFGGGIRNFEHPLKPFNVCLAVFL